MGLVISSYSNNQITFTFGNQYSVFGPVKNGDSFSMTLFGATFNGTASLGTGYTCTVSGMSGTTSFPVVVSESPAPPASIDAGGTFQTAPAAQVDHPGLGHRPLHRDQGATSLTVASQTTALDGLTAVGGSPSGAVSPNTESASASDLPQSDTLAADTPYTYATTYNPVTWQTGPGTGKVFLTPGDIDAEVTFVIQRDPDHGVHLLHAPLRGGRPRARPRSTRRRPPPPSRCPPPPRPSRTRSARAPTAGGGRPSPTPRRPRSPG